MTTHHSHYETAMELVGAQSRALRDLKSLPEALGLTQIQLHGLAAELSLPAGQQDAEKLMQNLVSLGAVCVVAAAVLVLPNLDEENQ